MLGMLEVVIGLIFVLLLLSLLATTVMELLSSGLALRGKNLEKALRNMLASSDRDEQLFRAFKNNSLYRQMSQRYGKRRRSPSYLSSESFQSILFDVLLRGEKPAELTKRIEQLPDDDLKNVLYQLLNDADYELDRFRENVRQWYDSVMDRASGWYKRNVQQILVLVGLLIAILFNADTIAIYERLESDPESLQQILTMAEDYLLVNQDIDSLQTTSPEFEKSITQIRRLINQEIDEASAPLGLGWGNVDLSQLNVFDWIYKVLGWIVTALAISLGAPFWFDLLRKLVNIRGSGKKPES